MIVTPFGDLEFESQPMTFQWLAAHGVRHDTLRKAFSRLGSSVLPAPLFGELNEEWVRVHYLHHMALLRTTQPDQTVSVQTISMNPMESEREFFSWHQMHNLLHERLDQALQVT